MHSHLLAPGSLDSMFVSLNASEKVHWPSWDDTTSLLLLCQCVAAVSESQQVATGHR